MSDNGCPCCYTTPCSESCTCARPSMSGGCQRCARYGSLEQRRRNAEALARVIDAAIAEPGVSYASVVTRWRNGI